MSEGKDAGEPLDSYQKILNMPAPSKPKPDFRSLLISTVDTILAVSNPHGIKLLHFDCSATKLCPNGTTLSNHNCKLVLA
jgi:hypothetical protein